MFSKLRPLLFKIDPEKAHNLAIKSLKFNLVSNVFDENKNDPIFKAVIFGKELDNPIGIAAGFDKNAEVYNPLFRLGFGFVEVGTITPMKQYGNAKPRVFRLVEDEALINRLGFNNHGADIVLKRIKSNDIQFLTELVAEDIRHSLVLIGKITGSVGVEDILDNLFKNFCIGK